jgi:predicted nuclease with TOPRIM domain
MRRTQGPRPDRRRIELAVNRLAANLAQLRDVPKQRALELDEDMRTLRDQMQRADNLVGDIETLTSENEVFRERIKALQWQPDNLA